jgi:putative transposase
MQNLYKRHRFPPSVIQYAVWLYYRFNLSVRDVEDLLAERNISVSYEAIRLWINKFGPEFTQRLRRRHSGFGDTYFLDEVFLETGGIPREIVTDKLRSYCPACRQRAHRTLIPEARHNTQQYANNRAELSHQPTRVRERGMRCFKSIKQAQRFLESHAAVYNLFNLHRHSLCRRFFKLFRLRSFATWDAVTAS